MSERPNLITLIVDPLLSEQNILGRSDVLAPKSQKLESLEKFLFEEELVKDWLSTGAEISTWAIEDVIKDLVERVKTQKPVQQFLPDSKEDQVLVIRLNRTDLESKVVSVKEPPFHENAEEVYLKVLDLLCRDVKKDLEEFEGQNFRRIIKSLAPWILNCIAENEDLREGIYDDTYDLEKRIIEAGILYIARNWTLFNLNILARTNNYLN